MRVLFVANASSIHTVRWVNALASRGLEVDLAHIPGHEPGQDVIDDSVKVHRLPVPGTSGYYLNASSLRRLTLRLRPDVTHVHYASGYGTLARVARIPYLLSVWGSDVYDFPYRSRTNLRIIQRNLLQASALASTSECMAKQVRSLIPDASLPISITPFGVDLARFDPDRLPARAEHQPFLIGNVKALSEPYGIDILIRAAGLLRDRLQGLPFEVRVYGDGPLRTDMERLIVELGLGGIVRLAGSVPHDLVPDVVAEMDIFCATSISESYGVSVIEAMAMRRPVVVSNNEGFTEVVGDAGLVVPRGDSVATAEALARLAADPFMRGKLGEAGRSRVQALYDWDANVDEMVSLYARFSSRR